QDRGDLHREPADDLIGCINQEPALRHLVLLGHERRHSNPGPGRAKRRKIVMISSRRLPSRARRRKMMGRALLGPTGSVFSQRRWSKPWPMTPSKSAT